MMNISNKPCQCRKHWLLDRWYPSADVSIQW